MRIGVDLGGTKIEGIILSNDGSIAAVGPVCEIPAGPFETLLAAAGMLVMPGLINLHQHHWYNLFKGLGGGMLREEWVGRLLLPCASRLGVGDLRASAYLGALEMIRTGTTTCLNHSVTTPMADEVEATIAPMAEASAHWPWG